jgi:hypothetical protein
MLALPLLRAQRFFLLKKRLDLGAFARPIVSQERKRFAGGLAGKFLVKNFPAPDAFAPPVHPFKPKSSAGERCNRSDTCPP